MSTLRYNIQVVPKLRQIPETPETLNVLWDNVVITLGSSLDGVFWITLPLMSVLLRDVQYYIDFHISIDDTCRSVLSCWNVTGDWCSSPPCPWDPWMDNFASSNGFTAEHVLSTLTFQALPCDGPVMARPLTTECLECPEFGSCDGSSLVKTDERVWRPNASVLPFYRCVSAFSEGCRRDELSTGTECRKHYTGFLCSGCVQGFAHSRGKCTKCPEDTVSLTFIVLATLLQFTILTLSTVMALRQDDEHAVGKVQKGYKRLKLFVIALKAIFNYFILTTLTSEIIGPMFDKMFQNAEEWMEETQRTQAVIRDLASFDAISIASSECYLRAHGFPDFTIYNRLVGESLSFAALFVLETFIAVILACIYPRSFLGIAFTVYGAVSVTLQAKYEVLIELCASALHPCAEYGFYPVGPPQHDVYLDRFVVDHSMSCDSAEYDDMRLLAVVVLACIGIG
eukprot:PhF_6_TR9075/c2_g1_i1/m.14149